MCLLETDIEEGIISPEEAEEMGYDEDVYLDKFPDPFMGEKIY